MMARGTKLLAAAAVAIALAAPVRAAELGADTVVATVNGENITLGHMAALRAGLPENYLSLPDDVLFNGLLKQLVQQTALAQIAEKNLSRAHADMLNVQRLNYLASVMIDVAVSGAVTEESVAAAYEALIVAPGPTREFNAAHILVATQEEAAAIRAELEAGGDFAEIAKAKSSDGAAPDGGNLGWFTLDLMVEPFGDAVAALEPGQLGGPVQTDFGWHVIKLLETRLAELPSIESVRPQIENDLRNQAVQDRLDSAVAESDVAEMVEGIDPTILKDPALLGQ